MKQCLFKIVLVAFACHAFGADSPREHLTLDANWKFHLGDDWPNALRLDKAGASGGPAAVRFNDQDWRTLDLPHDWAIELPFDSSADALHGYKPVGPKFPTNSVGWYRRTFDLSQEDSGKRLWLTFDGVFREATIWVNGWFVKHHEGGYYPFREDITDVVRFGDKNLITVKLDASKFEGWYYEGAGICRHVWLDKTAPVAIAPDGIFVYSKFAGNLPADKAEIQVEIRLLNPQTNDAEAMVKGEIISPEGKSVAKFKKSKDVTGGGEQTVKLETQVSSPVLWSPEIPKLYRLVTTVEVGGKMVDRQETEFGIRTFAFDANKGFLLNGQPYVIKGTCNHQDHAGVGEATPDALLIFRVARLKEMGCNAYRVAHNPPMPELLDACDRLGMIFMDENRLLGSDSENLRKLENQIRRDRNHACVAIWSICNEELQQQSATDGQVGLTMQNLVKRLDPTRPVTAAENTGDVYSGLMQTIEVRGWNYYLGPGVDNYHTKHPDQPNLGTEQASTVGTRGIYADDKARGYVQCYDVDKVPSWGNSAEVWWSFFAARPWLSGGFVWTGFDYRGEPTPYEWPCISSHFGILDTCGFPKDNFYYYQSWWTTNIVLHLLPHWNWPGKEGQEIRVDALSNCQQVELFLNGASLGRQTMKPNSKLTWQVKYAPGTLSAKGFDAAGKVIAETKVETTGDATQIQLTPDRKTINANGEDVAVFTVSALDAQGRAVPVAQNKINFAIAGAGKILGVGNGDPSCHEPDTLIAPPLVQSISVNDWRWKLTPLPQGGAVAPEYAPGFDDAAWNQFKPKPDGNANDLFLREHETAIYRAHVTLTEADLASPEIRLRFPGIDNHGWVYVNNQFVGESHDWSAQPVFEIRSLLQAGDNVIAVGVKNDDGEGGLKSGVRVELKLKPQALPWSRSLFNGLAQVIVQSTREAGEIKLTANADGLQTATATVTAQTSAGRPSVP